MSLKLDLDGEQQMVEQGRSFSGCLQAGDTVHLSGEIGAGKTTFVRGILAGLGYDTLVVSPTFSLVESYQGGRVDVHHFDLYRLEDARELELIGIRDYFTGNDLVIIEWPQRAVELLATPDYDIRIEQAGNGRCVSIIMQER